MLFRILGEVAIAGGSVPLPIGRQLTVLAVLLIRANRRVPREELVRWAWDGSAIGEAQLDKHVYFLRTLLRGLDRGADGPQLLTHKGYGYELRVREDDLDMLRFERLIQDSEAASVAGIDQEVGLIRAALRLWRGRHPLEGLPNRIGTTLGADLVSRRRRAVLRLCEREFRRDRPGEVLDDLRAMFDYHPTDRRVTGYLM